MRRLPFDEDKLQAILKDHPTPFHIYDEEGIRRNARALIEAFSWAPRFKEYFAVKATPNPYILKILREEGLGADCSSLPELVLAEKAGMAGEEIMFTSNNTPAREYQKANDLGAIINLDDISHIDFLAENARLPEILSIRFNPGPAREGNPFIGKPEEAKYGFTRDQLLEGYSHLKERGVKRFGLHAMVISNELNPQSFVDTGVMLFDLVVEIAEKVAITFEMVNLGGGIGIPYRPEEQAVDIEMVAAGIREAYQERIVAAGHPPLTIRLECGRMITGPFGYLVTRVLHEKRTYKNFIGLDANMANLMRPAIYGAYHHISVIGKEDTPATRVYDVTGSLCENNDKFAIDRPLPPLEIGDIVVIHDTGAHGHAMGFNYNGKLRSAELLLREDGSIDKIRRAETIEDYFATLDFSRL